jgi:hypothetical protein
MQGDKNDKSPAKAAPKKEMSNIGAQAFYLKHSKIRLCKNYEFVNKAVIPVLKAALASLMLMAPLPVLADTYLLMAEEDGCFWCAKWNKDIAHIYPKTAEGKAAPLRRYDLHSETPDVEFACRVHYTPTFILVEDGKERDRIEGYPGEDFFWSLLSMMLTRAEISLEEAS